MPLSVVQEGAGCPKGHGPEDLRVRANGVRDCRACANERAKRRRRVGRAAARGRPLILSATRTASEQIARLAPGVVIENAVQAALERGEARRTRSGDALVVELAGLGLEAVVARDESPLTRRKAWRPLAVRPQTRNRRERSS